MIDETRLDKGHVRLGQNEKVSARAYLVRFAPISDRRADIPDRPLRAMSGHLAKILQSLGRSPCALGSAPHVTSQAAKKTATYRSLRSLLVGSACAIGRHNNYSEHRTKSYLGCRQHPFLARSRTAGGTS